ncbi:MAG: LLM class flavin-dependent oxidoreductase [Candidatus Rokubacteria bacterium]|nr:LLM class flavin-dependent oxidoreductase [Candidatus Rokubacteria bacterium]
MRFGIRLLQHLGSPREIVALGVLAEQAGFDHVWFPSDKFMFHAWPLMVAVAEHTRRIVVGPNGAEPYGMSPGEIATSMATLDALAGGRTALGFGMHTTKMIEWLGLPIRDRMARLRESVAVMRRLWRGEVVEFHGRELDWSDQCYLRFQPVRDRIPIYLSGFEADDLALTGELGDGSLPMVTPPESARLMVRRVLAGVRAAGRDPREVDVCGCGWFSISADGRGTATDGLRDIVAYFGPYLEEEALETVGLGRGDFAEIAKLIQARQYAEARVRVTPEMLRLAVAGSPRDAIAKIECLAEAGVTQVSVGGPLGPDPRETVRLFGDRIIPYFR